MRGRKHHATGHCYSMLDRESRSLECRCSIEIHNFPLLHDRNGSQRVVLASLLGHALEHLKQRQRRDYQRPRRFTWFRECGRVGSVAEVLKPAGGVDHVHTRSMSRGTLVSMPFSDPREAFADRTGTSSIRPRYSMAWSFSPGLMPRASRIFDGITIWYLEDTVIVCLLYTSDAADDLLCVDLGGRRI